MAALDGLGFFTEGDLAAMGALLHYVNLTQMGERPAMRAPKREAPGALMLIDAATRASLELVRPKNDGAPTVFSAIDRTVTAAVRARADEPAGFAIGGCGADQPATRRPRRVHRRLGASRAHPQGAQEHAGYEPRAVAG